MVKLSEKKRDREKEKVKRRLFLVLSFFVVCSNDVCWVYLFEKKTLVVENNRQSFIESSVPHV